MHTVIIVSADASLPRWRSLPRKIQAINRELNTAENAAFIVTYGVNATLKPEVVNGRITHDWMDWLRNQHPGHDFVLFHMSDKQRGAWGIQPTLRGAHQRDFDLIAEMYLWADESTKRGHFNQFEQTALHEIRHALMRGMRIFDDTHEQHADGDIRGSFAQLDMAEYRPDLVNQARQLTLIERAIGYLARLVALTPPLYTRARAYVGRDASPEDRVSDIVGCAESVSCIVRDVLPDFPIITGTNTLWRRLEGDLRFERVLTPREGDIIISPTGTVANAPFPGHVGIFSRHGAIMSNESFDGHWEQNYTLESWQMRWGEAGFPVYFYRLV